VDIEQVSRPGRSKGAKEAKAMTLLYIIIGVVVLLVVVLALMGLRDIVRYRRIRNL